MFTELVLPLLVSMSNRHHHESELQMHIDFRIAESSDVAYRISIQLWLIFAAKLEGVVMLSSTTARVVVCGIAYASLAVFPMSGVTLLAPGHTWQYTFTDPTADASWNTTLGIGGTWQEGPAPFGNNRGGYPEDPQGEFDFATYWAESGGSGDDLWVRTSVDLTDIDLSTVTWRLGVDNAFKLYLNGALVSDGDAEGYTFRWEYSGEFGSGLTQGINELALALDDRGVLTAFDMEVTGSTPNGTQVPEPAGLTVSALVLLAIAGLDFGAQRRPS
jgi:hypothetical protein